ncbi:MAG: SIMPL domain-containing protein [bacterium]|nr:SIMPL domain-containing protein [bacterium]
MSYLKRVKLCPWHHFRITELKKYRSQACSFAIKATYEKADAFAKELGQNVGKPYSIQENRSLSRRSNGTAQNVIQMVNPHL